MTVLTILKVVKRVIKLVRCRDMYKIIQLYNSTIINTEQIEDLGTLYQCYGSGREVHNLVRYKYFSNYRRKNTKLSVISYCRALILKTMHLEKESVLHSRNYFAETIISEYVHFNNFSIQT